MELSLRNKGIKITAKFYDNMVKLEGSYTFDEEPKNLDKKPCKVIRRYKSGKVTCYCEIFIPNSFIYDALCINDEETKAQFVDWLKNMVAQIAKQRGVEIPNKDKE